MSFVSTKDGVEVYYKDWGRKDAQPLSGTAALTMEGDIASHLVAGVDRFLLRKLDESAAGRARHC